MDEFKIPKIVQEIGGISQPCDVAKPESHLTDTGNAEMIAQDYGEKVRFDHKRKRWLIWNSHRWEPDTDGTINRIAIESAKKRYLNAANIPDSKDREKASHWAIQSESKIRIDAATGLSKNLYPITDAGLNWDTHQMLLSCPNGIVDLRTGELRDGKPEDRITMTTIVEYDPDAQCPRWEQFIDEVFEGNKDLTRYIHKALGYSITANVNEQVAFFCYGSGSNGKSVLFKTIREILGDYAYDAPASLLQRNAMATNTNDVAATEFKRFLVSSETLSTSKLNEQRLKGWTGGDNVTARYLYKELTTFTPTVKPWLFINHKPQVEDDSFGFWRRVRLIPFNRIFKGVDADKNLLIKLKFEYKGILNWLVKGCLLWQREGLDAVPDCVSQASKDYQIENDVLAEFIFDKCHEDIEAKVQASLFYKEYTQWAANQGYSPKDTLTHKNFSRKMSDKYRKGQMHGKFYYYGIMIQSDADKTSTGNDEGDPKVTQTEARVTQTPPFYKLTFVNSHEEELLKTPLLGLHGLPTEAKSSKTVQERYQETPDDKKEEFVNKVWDEETGTEVLDETPLPEPSDLPF
jgi:putative DNA primase/helicase